MGFSDPKSYWAKVTGQDWARMGTRQDWVLGKTGHLARLEDWKRLDTGQDWEDWARLEKIGHWARLGKTGKDWALGKTGKTGKTGN